MHRNWYQGGHFCELKNIIEVLYMWFLLLDQTPHSLISFLVCISLRMNKRLPLTPYFFEIQREFKNQVVIALERSFVLHQILANETCI